MAENSTYGKLGLVAAVLACVPPLPLFGVKLPTLPALEQGVLTAVFVAALAACSIVASRRPVLGLLVLPVLFFGAMCLACGWVATRCWTTTTETARCAGGWGPRRRGSPP